MQLNPWNWINVALNCQTPEALIFKPFLPNKGAWNLLKLRKAYLFSSTYLEAQVSLYLCVTECVCVLCLARQTATWIYNSEECDLIPPLTCLLCFLLLESAPPSLRPWLSVRKQRMSSHRPGSVAVHINEFKYLWVLFTQEGKWRIRETIWLGISCNMVFVLDY